MNKPLPFPATEPPAAEIAARLRDRYRAAAIAPSAAWNEVISGLLAHRSVRAYDDRPVGDETLAAAIAAAQSAANSSNIQSWSVVAVRDPGRKARLADLSGGQKHIRQAPLFLVWLADLARVERLGHERGIEVEGIHYLETLFVGIVDAALAAQNAVVALESLGLGTVYIGGIRDRPDQVAAELGLPPRILPVVGLCVGYPDPNAPAAVKPRLPQPAILHHETYSAERQRDPIRSYEADLRDFQAEQGLPVRDWGDLAVGRIRRASDLHGRDRIREYLDKIGFELR